MQVDTGRSRRYIKEDLYHNLCKNQCKIVIDCDFPDLTNLRQGKSLVTQIMQAYGYSRRSNFPIEFTLAGLSSGYLMEALTNVSGYPNWYFSLTSQPVEEICSVENTVFLSADSDCKLDKIENEKVYVIGAIVDRNSHKGILYNKAKRLGYKSMSLPIRDYIELDGSHILDLCSVFKIFINYYEYNANWTEALLASIPQRKLKH